MEALILSPESAPLTRSIDDYPEGIIIPIDKPYRWTSADVIRKVKFAAIRHFGKKNLKVGHAGTLDPLATGVLLVCIGKATKLAEELQAHDKEYVAGITFGATTPSYDLEKEIDRFFPHEHITPESVAEALPAFIGEQDQIAPLFSAKSVDGVRAYELARKLYKSDGSLDEAARDLIRVSRINITELELLELPPWPQGERVSVRIRQGLFFKPLHPPRQPQAGSMSLTILLWDCLGPWSGWPAARALTCVPSRATWARRWAREPISTRSSAAAAASSASRTP